MNLREIVQQNRTITLAQLKEDGQLVLEIQKILSAWGLYPAGQWWDGDWGTRTQNALNEFCQIKGIADTSKGVIDKAIAEALLDPNVAELRLKTAKDRNKFFDMLLLSEKGFSEGKLRIRDRQIENSPYNKDIPTYPNRLIQKTDNVQIVSFGEAIALSNPTRTVTFSPYPKVGIKPNIDNSALNFLHPDITEACVCVGSFVNGEIRANWLGKNALDSVQFWSATKTIAILNLICKLNKSFINSDIDDCVVRASGSTEGLPFHELAIDLISYRAKYGSSNSIGLTFKRFETYSGLENWLKQITGNTSLSFKGRYGENALFNSPQLYDRKTKRIVAQPAPEEPRGDNLVSAYDLTRLISMLGWHYHLPSAARLPNAQWYSLESLARAMGTDRARYIDIAIERLGLQNVIKDPVIISKVGWGSSDSRNRYEITYTALVQLIDRRPNATGNPSKLRTFAMTLRAAKAFNPRDIDREAKEMDARMAAEVTEIMRRIAMEELA